MAGMKGQVHVLRRFETARWLHSHTALLGPTAVADVIAQIKAGVGLAEAYRRAVQTARAEVVGSNSDLVLPTCDASSGVVSYEADRVSVRLTTDALTIRPRPRGGLPRDEGLFVALALLATTPTRFSPKGTFATADGVARLALAGLNDRTIRELSSSHPVPLGGFEVDAAWRTIGAQSAKEGLPSLWSQALEVHDLAYEMRRPTVKRGRT